MAGKKQAEATATDKQRRTPERRTAQDILIDCGNDLMIASKRADAGHGGKILSLAIQCKDMAATIGSE